MHKMSSSRRKLLKTALMVGLSTTFGRTFAASLTDQKLNGKKIIVIGAGIAGLAAAHKLTDQGAQITLFEAKPHIGGRLFTDYSLGVPFEVGAGWIHGPSDDNPIAQLAKNINAKTIVTDDESLSIFSQGGKQLSEKKRQDIDEKWQQILDLIDEEVEMNTKASLHQAIKNLSPKLLKDQGVIWALSAYTEFSSGGSLENISASYHDEDQAFEGDDVVVITGYDKILTPLAAGIDIKLSTVVSDIEYNKNGVTIHTSEGIFSADYILCSLPLGVLKSDNVTFNPPLPKPYRAAVNRMGFGSVTKIALKFTAPFWDVDTQYFGIQTAIKGRWNYWLNYRTFSDENILLGLAMGDYALTADNMNDAKMQADALQVLRDVWGEKVGDPIEIRTTHWSLDPHTFGAYSYPKAGSTPADYKQLAKPIGKRLWLIGEHTIFEYAGTVHGAYLSGLRAAEQIIKL